MAPATNQNKGLGQNLQETSNTSQYTFLQKQNSSVCNLSGKIADFHFSHYKYMETLSCHSNQRSYPPGIINTNYVEATVRNMYTKYRLHPLDSFLEEDFLMFFKIFPYMGPLQPIKMKN